MDSSINGADTCNKVRILNAVPISIITDWSELGKNFKGCFGQSNNR